MLAAAFVFSIAAGVILFLATGGDYPLRLAIVIAAVISLLWSLVLYVPHIKTEIRHKQYLRAIAAGVTHAGVTLLILYFVWFLLYEMLNVKALIPDPTHVSKKIIVAGFSLTLLGVFTAFIDAALRKSARGKWRG
ncbi:MAG: hypothetical protein M3268_04015 [Acidobacteriota bacterium]|nr:hypothetical protein [Acidobacteriota bacterium]